MIVGSIAFGVCVIAAIAAFTARETYRVHMNDLGDKNAMPVPKAEYDRMREQTIANEKLAKAAG